MQSKILGSKEGITVGVDTFLSFWNIRLTDCVMTALSDGSTK